MTTSSLSAFLGEIGRHKLLTPEQELTLGRKVQAMAPLQDSEADSAAAGKCNLFICFSHIIRRRTLMVGFCEL